MGVSQSKNQNKNQGRNSKKINNDEKKISNNSTKDVNNTDNKLSEDNSRFNKDIETKGYKSKNDPGYSWLHDSLQGKKVLSSLTDAFYMD